MLIGCLLVAAYQLCFKKREKKGGKYAKYGKNAKDLERLEQETRELEKQIKNIGSGLGLRGSNAEGTGSASGAGDMRSKKKR